jgi:hypothetical protein
MLAPLDGFPQHMELHQGILQLLEMEAILLILQPLALT